MTDNRSVNNPLDPLRQQLVRILDWEEAHVGFDKAVSGVAPEHHGTRAAGFEHTLWQLLEHIRLAQKDLLDFCANRNYVHTMRFPDDYWPRSPAPPDAEAWAASLADCKADREALKDLIRDTSVDLFAVVPKGKKERGQTYLRTILVTADHNAYHLGQFVAVRRALGIWR